MVGVAMLGRERVALWAGRTADDVASVAAGEGRGLVPRAAIGHRALDGEHAAVEVDDHEVERLGVGLVHGAILFLVKSVNEEQQSIRICALHA